jgi:C4-dicarboxylate-specific signal transduction histidine kinase
MNNGEKQDYEEKLAVSAEHLLSTMEDLLLWSKGQMENFAPEFRQVSVRMLFDYVKHAFVASKIKLSFPALTNDPALVTDEHYLKTIMLNLTNNAANALSDTDSPLITWEWVQDHDHCFLIISDNGPGADEQKFRPLYDDSVTVGIKNGLGLHIIRDLARAIGCQILVDTKRSSGVKISIVVKRAFHQSI